VGGWVKRKKTKGRAPRVETLPRTAEIVPKGIRKKECVTQWKK